MLDVKQATKVFSAGTASEHPALNGLDLHLDDGEFVTIIGSNGAGKSTLLKIIVGELARTPARWCLEAGRRWATWRRTRIF